MNTDTHTHTDSPCPGLCSGAGQRATLAGLRPLRGLQVVGAHSGEGDLGGELRLSDQDPAVRRDEVRGTCALTCSSHQLTSLSDRGSNTQTPLSPAPQPD